MTAPHAALAALLLASLLAPAGCGEEARNPPRPAAAPRILQAPLEALAPGDGTALADLQGRRVIVNFWATWCTPCREEMPALQRMSDALAPRGIVVIGISVDADRHLAREFLLQAGVRFANFSDPAMTYASTVLGIKALPATFALDAHGAIAARVLGARDWNGAQGKAFLHEAYGLDP